MNSSIILRISNAKQFWRLYDDLPETIVLQYRDMLLYSYNEGTLYRLTKIPCFCICKNQFIFFLWMDPNFRKKGIATQFLQLLEKKAKYVDINCIPKHGSTIDMISFFDKCNIICVI